MTGTGTDAARSFPVLGLLPPGQLQPVASDPPVGGGIGDLPTCSVHRPELFGQPNGHHRHELAPITDLRRGATGSLPLRRQQSCSRHSSVARACQWLTLGIS